MYCDLFSSLDGANTWHIWGVSFGLLALMMKNITWNTSVNTHFFNYISNMWKTSSYRPFHLFLYSIFMLILMNNFIGLSPLTYGMTSNLFMVSVFSLSLWLMLILSGIMNNPKKSCAHLAPSGAPMVLMPFLILIETVSILIRPLTLTVRLIANISAGHIVMGLMAIALSSLVGSWLSMSLLMILMIFYMLFEFFVSCIQAYIFTLLVNLYGTEHP
uniref:ATP synthase F0 subunit 6 n=1 Tax=Euglandina singleyana TaxID=169637 RepID=UPI002551D03F|nr:ATP synthase F0 subunit 6 [Euglandina singleyana]WFQ82724.1 ATP synthase F0 subunit 6 [Euglandina singleyana]